MNIVTNINDKDVTKAVKVNDIEFNRTSSISKDGHTSFFVRFLSGLKQIIKDIIINEEEKSVQVIMTESAAEEINNSYSEEEQTVDLSAAFEKTAEYNPDDASLKLY